MFSRTLFIAWSLLSLFPNYVMAKDVRGVFSFMWAGDIQKYGTPRSFDLPYISGATIVTEWRLIQPSKDNYRWKLIDVPLMEAKKYGKLLNIGIFPGSTSPSYVMNRSALFSSTRNSHAGELISNVNANKDIKFPVPWDEYYKKEWLAFIKKLSDRYGKDKNIGYLQISGPSITAMEMAIRIKQSEWQRFRNVGYTEELYIECWKNQIDEIVKIWPGTLAITLGNSIPNIGTKHSDKVWQEVVKYASEKLGDRLIIKLAFLNGKWWQYQTDGDHAKPLIDYIISISSTKHTGAEMLWKSRTLNESVNGPLSDALNNGISSGMKFIEVYQDDIGSYNSNQAYEPYKDSLKKAQDIMLSK